MNCRPNDKLRYCCTAVGCILHCSDKNVVLTITVAGARARPSQYLCNMITFSDLVVGLCELQNPEKEFNSSLVHTHIPLESLPCRILKLSLLWS